MKCLHLAAIASVESEFDERRSVIEFARPRFESRQRMALIACQFGLPGDGATVDPVNFLAEATPATGNRGAATGNQAFV